MRCKECNALLQYSRIHAHDGRPSRAEWVCEACNRTVPAPLLNDAEFSEYSVIKTLKQANL